MSSIGDRVKLLNEMIEHTENMLQHDVVHKLFPDHDYTEDELRALRWMIDNAGTTTTIQDYRMNLLDYLMTLLESWQGREKLIDERNLVRELMNFTIESFPPSVVASDTSYFKKLLDILSRMAKSKMHVDEIIILVDKLYHISDILPENISYIYSLIPKKAPLTVTDD